MSEYLNRNLKILNFRNPSLVQELMNSPISKNVTFFKSRNNLNIPCWQQGDKQHTYHSRFDPLKEGNKMKLNHCEEGLKIFLGLGGAYHISPFLGKSKILIIESQKEHLKALFSGMDYTPLLSAKDISILCDPSSRDLSIWLKDNYLPLLDGGIELIPLRSQTCFELDRYKAYSNEIEQAIKEISHDCATQKKMGRLWQRNIITNYKKAIHSPMTLPLSKDFSNAFLAAAGPTLSRQKEKIQNLPSHTLLMSVDTALPTLLKWGIEPHFVVTIDPQAIGYLHFMEKWPSSSTLLADIGCSVPSQLSQIKWFKTLHPLAQYLWEGDSSFFALKGGAGNVTQAALEILISSGYENITIGGADFSFPQGKTYVQGSYFYSWYRSKCLKTSPFENHLLNLVLNQDFYKVGENPSFIYRTNQLDTYEKDLKDFIKRNQGQFKKQDDLLISLTFPAANIYKASHPSSGSKKSLLYYRKKLESLNPLTRGAEVATLLPLAYTFLSGNDDKKAINDARKYTIQLLNHHIP